MDAPIFIVGPPRSGTTLTAKILGRHSRLFMPGEVHFFEDIFSRRKELGDPADTVCRQAILERLVTLFGRFNEPLDQQRVETLFADPEMMRDLEAACGSYRELLSAFMEIQARSHNKARWGNNAPRDLFNVAEILAFYPDAKILVCVRDVRDFLISYRDKWMATSADNVKRLKALYHPLVTTLLWKSSVREIAGLTALVPEGSIMRVRYEDLVTGPESTIRSICDFIGEQFEEQMLAIDSNNSSTKRQGSGIYPDSVGRWRSGLDDEDVHVAQMLTRTELAHLGYALERIEANPAKVTAIFLSTPFALFHALQANREKRGPLLPYLMRRAAPFLWGGRS